MLATASVDGDVFFFNTSGIDNLQLYEPLCMIKLGDDLVINDMKWDSMSANLLIGC